MPCGGIYPINPDGKYFPGLQDRCFTCGKSWGDASDKYYYFCEEWDCYLHKNCLEKFLRSEEGKIVIAHNHLIEVYTNDLVLGDND